MHQPSPCFLISGACDVAGPRLGGGALRIPALAGASCASRRFHPPGPGRGRGCWGLRLPPGAGGNATSGTASRVSRRLRPQAGPSWRRYFAVVAQAANPGAGRRLVLLV